MVGVLDARAGTLVREAGGIITRSELAHVLRQLRRREARAREGSELTYRELAAKTGWSRAVIGEYFAGDALPPTDRFDLLIQLLGATPAEQGVLATARDRVEETRRLDTGTGAEQRAGGGTAPVPRQLPAGAQGFVGRDRQLAELDRLAATSDQGSTVVISALSGAAGVGKTTLAVRWAHRVADRFPDGQLYVDLRGYDPDEPLPAADALAGFLRSLGADGAHLPTDLSERAARYRTLLAGRRMLVVLDNAYAAEQVRPLLPGSPSCLVLVTSRDSLAGLVARDGARRIELDVLTLEEAVSLLRTLVGARVDAEPEAAAALAERCGRLPLALRVAAEQAAVRPDDPLADLLDCLSSEQRRLDSLDSGEDPRSRVRAVFSWSYRLLPADTGRAFRRLGLHPTGDLDPYAVAALCGVDLASAQELLASLVRAHLVQQTRRLRYGMHDLLRAYAAELATDQVEPDEAKEAHTRLFDYYRHAAATAMATLFPHHRHGRPNPASSSPAPSLDETAAARAWLDHERDNLVAVCAHAAGHGWTAHSVDISQILGPYLDTQYYAEAEAVHTIAAGVASTGPDRAGVLTSLGRVCNRLGRPEEALAHLHEALASYRGSSGDHSREIVTRLVLGYVYFSLGRYTEALEHDRAGLAIARVTGDRGAEAKQLINIGETLCRLEDYRDAATHYQQAATILCEVELPRVSAAVAHGLGLAYEGMGRYPEALTYLDGALAFLREFAERRDEAEVLETKGSVLRRLGRYREAANELERAITISEDVDDRVRARALNTLGETLRAMGRPDEARIHHDEALDLAEQMSDYFERSRALDGIADASRDAGDLATALAFWRRAHASYADLALPAAQRVHDKIVAAERQRRQP
jgi:tetratricopeptide (TPR) repeat protein/transcriptional regulator with XRE-family HTH domain